MTYVTVIVAMVNKDLLTGLNFMVAHFIAIEGNNMTFSLWKLGLQQTVNCDNDIFMFVCGYPKFVYAFVCSEL